MRKLSMEIGPIESYARILFTHFFNILAPPLQSDEEESRYQLVLLNCSSLKHILL